MRYFLAILSLVIAGVLLILGIGQRTFLAGDDNLQRSIELGPSSGNFAVIPAELFAEFTGKPALILTGSEVFLAVGHERDVNGWLATTDHVTLSIDPESRDLQATDVQVQTAEVNDADEAEDDSSGDTQNDDGAVSPLPMGSDLWLSEYTGTNTLRVSMEVEPNQSVLIGPGSEEAEAPNITVSWAKERSTPLAGPLLVTGGLFAALGAILYLFALDHDRRGLGPRRRRKGPFQGLRNSFKGSGRKRVGTTMNVARRQGRTPTILTAAVVGVTLLVTGCSPSYWPQPAEETVVPDETAAIEETSAPIPVTDEQLENITAAIAEVLGEADAELDEELLETRVTGPAFEQRQANYTIRSEEPEYQAPPVVTSERLGYDLIQSTEEWPRTMFVTVRSAQPGSEDAEEAEEDPEESDAGTAEGDSTEEEETPEAPEATPSLALLLRQDTARDNYLVSHIISLRGGIEMPAAAPVEEGTAVLADNIKTLILEPREVAAAFASVLQEGTESENAEYFALEDEVLTERMGAAWAEQQDGENVRYSAEVSPNEIPAVTLSTGQGGALVIASVLDDHITTASGERYRIELSNIEQALGLSGSQKEVVQHWQHNVLFYVPSADSGNKIQILGSSSEIIGASS